MRLAITFAHSAPCGPMKNRRLLGVLGTVALLAALWFGFAGGKTEGHLGEEAAALTGEILAFGPRPPGSPELDQVRNHLRKELENAGWKVTLQEFERGTPVGPVKFSNLRARMPLDGTDTWTRPVDGLLCAHIDSKLFKDRIFLGADDAASACAAVVEIGKHLAANEPEQAARLELVLFDGEEAFAENMTILDGLYGSRYYANEIRTSENKPKFGILLDMIGHKNLSIRIPSDSPEELAELMFDIAKKRKVSGHFGTAPGPIMDDHLPLNLIGIPTLDIIGDFSSKSWWHTPGDSAAIISSESLGISIGVVLEMLDELFQDS